jgi:NAD(P)-dependent dehydrogenase (short-subunit alcohol dehydrogenase family)
LKLDVTDAAATESVLAAIDSAHGAVTILVNNAASPATTCCCA